MARCPRCSYEFFSRIELPVEPLFTLDVAAELIPFGTVEALRGYLKRKHPEWRKFYRVVAHGVGTRILTRFLSAEQIKAIREEVVRETWRNPKRALPASDQGQDAGTDVARAS